MKVRDQKVTEALSRHIKIKMKSANMTQAEIAYEQFADFEKKRKNEMKSKRLLIISCSARKSGDKLCPAIERYQSPKFFVLRRFLKNFPCNAPVIWILSAKYGLIGADKKIRHYDTAMLPERARKLQKEFPHQFYILFKYSFGNQPPSDVLLHLPKAYESAFAEQIGNLKTIAPVKSLTGRPGERNRRMKTWLEQTSWEEPRSYERNN